MASLQQLRRRLKSIKSIHQITKAMEMIATSKMKRATKKAVMAREYAQAAMDILGALQGASHSLLEKREIKKTALIFVTADRGLCGGFNSALYRELSSFVKEVEDKNQSLSIITVGKKGRDFVLKFFRDKFVADFTGIKDEILYQEVSPIAHLAMEEFLSKKYDQIKIIYSSFVSNFVQRPVVSQLLPIIAQSTEDEENKDEIEYLLEPSSSEVLEALIPQFIETQIFHTLLESKAGEHSARMVAMKNATDNAKDLMDELYLTYHSLRQATITAELVEMTTAKKAMED